MASQIEVIKPYAKVTFFFIPVVYSAVIAAISFTGKWTVAIVELPAFQRFSFGLVLAIYAFYAAIDKKESAPTFQPSKPKYYLSIALQWACAVVIVMCWHFLGLLNFEAVACVLSHLPLGRLSQPRIDLAYDCLWFLAFLSLGINYLLKTQHPVKTGVSIFLAGTGFIGSVIHYTIEPNWMFDLILICFLGVLLVSYCLHKRFTRNHLLMGAEKAVGSWVESKILG